VIQSDSATAAKLLFDTTRMPAELTQVGKLNVMPTWKNFWIAWSRL